MKKENKLKYNFGRIGSSVSQVTKVEKEQNKSVV